MYKLSLSLSLLGVVKDGKRFIDAFEKLSIEGKTFYLVVVLVLDLVLVFYLVHVLNHPYCLRCEPEITAPYCHSSCFVKQVSLPRAKVSIWEK